MRLHIRWMIRRDLTACLAIERASFPHPWEEEDFLRHLRERSIIGMVAEDGATGRVVGYMMYTLHKTMLVVNNFAVAEDCRRQGVGDQMVAKLLGKLTSHRRSKIVWDVGLNNLNCQLFLREMGFTAVQYLHEHYTNTGGAAEDGVRFEYRVGEPVVTLHNRVSQYINDI